MRSIVVGSLLGLALAGSSAAPASAATTRECGRVFSDGFSLLVQATGASCRTGRSVARRYDIALDQQTILGFRCTFVRRGLVRCAKGSAKLRFDLRAQE